MTHRDAPPVAACACSLVFTTSNGCSSALRRRGTVARTSAPAAACTRSGRRRQLTWSAHQTQHPRRRLHPRGGCLWASRPKPCRSSDDAASSSAEGSRAMSNRAREQQRQAHSGERRGVLQMSAWAPPPHRTRARSHKQRGESRLPYDDVRFVVHVPRQRPIRTTLPDPHHHRLFGRPERGAHGAAWTSHCVRDARALLPRLRAALRAQHHSVAELRRLAAPVGPRARRPGARSAPGPGRRARRRLRRGAAGGR